MPKKTLSIHPFFAPNQQSILTYAYGVVQQATVNDAGIKFAAVRVPEDMDVSREVSCFSTLVPSGNYAFPSNIVLELGVTVLRDDGFTQSLSFNQITAVPVPWNLNVPKRYLHDNGSGVSFPGGTFTPNESLSFGSFRDGARVEDTYPITTRLLTLLELVYYVRCQFPQ
jgi:hypothetical protein